MVSAQEPGLIRLYIQRPSGQKDFITQLRTESAAPAGGASEGAASAVSTPEKLITVNSKVSGVNDDILLVTFEPDGADTLDATDCIWQIGVVTPAGSKILGRAQFQNPALSDQALVAGKEVTVAGYKITEGSLRVGGKQFIDFQDDD